MNLSNKTFLPTQSYKNRNWFLIDCEGQTLGRLATIVAGLLKGKVKPYYHPSVDIGDYVILINADLIVLNQRSTHYFVLNPGRPGSSLKIRQVIDCLSQVVIEKAIKGMLPKTETKRLMRRLNIYSGAQYPHGMQKPIELNLLNYHSSAQLKIKTTK
jgi:large subunit ribosomal protein L13